MTEMSIFHCSPKELKKQLDRIERLCEGKMKAGTPISDRLIIIEKKLDVLCEEQILRENQESFERNNPRKKIKK